MPHFQFQPFTPNTGTLAELIAAPGRIRANALRQGGEAQARAQQLSGQTWGNAIGSIGQIASGALTDYRQEQLQKPAREGQALDLEAKRMAVEQAKRERLEDQALRALFNRRDEGGQPVMPKADEIYGVVGPNRGTAIVKSIEALQTQRLENDTKAREWIGQTVGGVLALPEPMRAEGYTLARQKAIALGLPAASIPEQYNEAWLKQQLTAAVSADKQWEAAQPKLQPVTPGTPVIDLRNPTAGPVYTAPEKVLPPKPVVRMDRETGKLTTMGEVPGNAQVVQEPAPTRISVNGMGAGGERLTPDAIEYTATKYRILGTGAIPTRIDGPERVRIMNEAAKQDRALGNTPAQAVQKQAAFKSDAASLTKMSTMKASAESFETKALAQADKVVELSQRVGRAKWPIVNGAILAGKTEIAGDPDATLLLNAALTFTAEYAKIIEGSTGSAQGSSDAARRATEKLLSPKYNHGTIAKAVDLMKWEMAQTIQGYDATIAHITERMGGAPSGGGAKTDPLGIR